jgi:drug/metabolite transporter (DMT)-like permease
MKPAAPGPAQGRLLIVLAAVLWSLSGGFTKLLTRDTPLGLNEPPLPILFIALARVGFAGLALTPTLRRRDVSFRPMMLVMVATFAAMNAMFVMALAEGTAANAILLQYTAPLWVFLASVAWLGERADRRSLVAVAVGLVGIAIIIVGGWRDAEPRVVALGLGSGFTYAGVLVCLRVLRDASSRWLTVLNGLGAAAVLVPFVPWHTAMTVAQLATLFVFGTVQMGVPYWLISRGLRSVSPQEAGAITLLEPILNPIWAYLVVGEVPASATAIGGIFILGGLAWRYWPVRRS